MHEWGVTSEVGRLRTVLVHRPGQEHRWTLPWNKEAFLFDDVLDVEEARTEHKDFTAKLTRHGVQEVLFVTDLLGDICADRDRVGEILNEVIGDELEQRGADIVVDPEKLRPKHLISGYPDVFPSYDGSDDRILLNPAPNLYFTRDSAFAVPDAMVISSPAKAARRREARLMRSLLRRHPKFSGRQIYDGILSEWRRDAPADQQPLIEGGDVLVADSSTVVIGLGERTNERGAEMLIEYLFSRTPVERVIKIHIPAERQFMHLDTVMTFIDRRQILTLPYLWEAPELYKYIFEKLQRQSRRMDDKKNDEGESINFESSLQIVTKSSGGKPPKRKSYDNVLEGLDKEGVIDEDRIVYVAGRKERFSTPEEHIIAALREQWNDAANVLALKPGQVICYQRNDRTQRALEEAGLEVVTLRGGELVRGRGGARCMSMPLLREVI